MSQKPRMKKVYADFMDEDDPRGTAERLLELTNQHPDGVIGYKEWDCESENPMFVHRVPKTDADLAQEREDVETRAREEAKREAEEAARIFKDKTDIEQFGIHYVSAGPHGTNDIPTSVIHRNAADKARWPNGVTLPNPHGEFPRLVFQ